MSEQFFWAKSYRKLTGIDFIDSNRFTEDNVYRKLLHCVENANQWRRAPIFEDMANPSYWCSGTAILDAVNSWSNALAKKEVSN